MITTLKFKGSRDYLHSTDFYSWFSEDVCSAEQFVSKLTFKKIIRKQCKILWSKQSGPAAGFVEFKNLATSEVTRASIMETDESVTERYDFDEDELVADALLDMDEKSIFISGNSDCSTIELVVAATKKLHNTLYSVNTKRWLVGQLSFASDLPSSYENIRVTIKRMMDNRFSVSEVYIDEKSIGTIQFIVGE